MLRLSWHRLEHGLSTRIRDAPPPPLAPLRLFSGRAFFWNKETEIKKGPFFLWRVSMHQRSKCGYNVLQCTMCPSPSGSSRPKKTAQKWEEKKWRGVRVFFRKKPLRLRPKVATCKKGRLERIHTVVYSIRYNILQGESKKSLY